MFVELETSKKQPKARWNSGFLKKESKKTYMECGKAPMICICPKCGVHHESFIQWTGRGTPRIYCKECRSHVSSVNDFNQYYSVSLLSSTTHRKYGHCFE